MDTEPAAEPTKSESLALIMARLTAAMDRGKAFYFINVGDTGTLRVEWEPDHD